MCILDIIEIFEISSILQLDPAVAARLSSLIASCVHENYLWLSNIDQTTLKDLRVIAQSFQRMIRQIEVTSVENTARPIYIPNGATLCKKIVLSSNENIRELWDGIGCNGYNQFHLPRPAWIFRKETPLHICTTWHCLVWEITDILGLTALAGRRDFDAFTKTVEIARHDWLYLPATLKNDRIVKNTVRQALSPASLLPIFLYVRLCSLFFLIKYSRKKQKASYGNASRADDLRNY